MPDPAVSWIIIIILLILHFFFSASETAIACCNKFKVQTRADEGSRTAKLLLKIINKYDRTLTIVLIGNNIVAIVISAVSTVLFLDLFRNSGLQEDTISLICSLIMTFVVYILGDTFPKTIARSIPDTISYAFTYPIYGLMIVLTPIAIVFESFTKLLLKLFRVKEEEEFTEKDLETALEEASEQEMIDEDQAEIVQSTMDFLDTNVKEVLTKREQMYALNIKDLNHESLQKILVNNNYSRIPIYDKVFDNIIGVLLTKIYFEEFEKDPHVSIRSILQKPYFINSNIKIDDLFNGFRKHHTHIAIIRDTHNHVIGMVTMEDVLEEIVSDISEPSLDKRRKTV